jgi:hypothetical protein
MGIGCMGDVRPSGGDRHSGIWCIDNFYYPGVAQRAYVVRLAAGSRVEGGLIKDNLPAGAIGRAGNDGGVEFAEEGVVVVEPVRQVSSLLLQRKNNIEGMTASAGTR